jgi:hypothetical protein
VLLDMKEPAHPAVRFFADQHAADRRDLLQVGGQIDGVSDHRVAALGARAQRTRDDRAGVDPDAHLHGR